MRDYEGILADNDALSPLENYCDKVMCRREVENNLEIDTRDTLFCLSLGNLICVTVSEIL